MKQYRLYEDNTLVIKSGRMAEHLGFIDDGSRREIAFASAEEAEAYIDSLRHLRWCNDFEAHETMCFRTWYQA